MGQKITVPYNSFICCQLQNHQQKENNRFSSLSGFHICALQLQLKEKHTKNDKSLLIKLTINKTLLDLVKVFRQRISYPNFISHTFYILKHQLYF